MEAKMKYVPTKNLSQVWYNLAERKEFEAAAEEAAKEEFLKELKDEDCRSVDDYKSYLAAEFSDGDIAHDMYELQDERDDEQVLAGHPDITPEQSFNRLVESYVKDLYVQAHWQVLESLK